MKCFYVLLCCLFVAPFNGAVSAPGEPEVVPHLRIPQIGVPLIVDGDLDKPEWEQAAVIPDLSQSYPHPGSPMPYRTEVRLLRDTDHLYVGIRNFDPSPDQIDVHTVQRDASQGNDDHVAILLNTFDDHRNAYVFMVNAKGARADGLVTNGSDAIDYGWDGVWAAKTRRTSTGWDVEIALSTRSLQFRADSDQWGFNVARYVPRGTVRAKWAGISLLYSPSNPQVYGILDGMAGAKVGNGFEIKPYLLFRTDQLNPDSKHAEAGGEVKYNFTPALSGTFTVNTDFAQTEADSQQINLTRFSLFFPEKRQFFLDGSSLFSFNSGAMNGSINGGFIPYYSRTIGLSDGKTVPIDEGAKITGQIDGLSMGILGVRTGLIQGVPSENLSVARLAYDLTDDFQFGTLLTHGDPSGRTSSTFDGFDFAWQTRNFLGGHAFKATGWTANTSGSLSPGDTRGWGAELNYPNYTWWVDAQINSYGDSFDPALGFLPRPGTRQYWEEVGYFPSPAPEARSSTNYYQWDEQFNQINSLNGNLQSYLLDVDPGIAYLDGSAFYVHLFREYEAINTPFAIDNNVTVPIGAYVFDRYRLEYDSPTTKDLSVILKTTRGQFYGGHATDNYAQVKWTYDGSFELSLANESVFAKLPAGRFVQRLSQLGAAYSFSPDLSISTFVQYDTSVDQLGFNTRLHWIISSDKDLYVVWNRNWRQAVVSPSGDIPDVADTVIIKLTWTFE